MLANSLRLRTAEFAYLFGPPRLVQREEASKLHGAVCDSLMIDDIAFQYSSPGDASKPESKGFSIVLQRPEGRGGIKVLIDAQAYDRPIRMLVAYSWPPSLEHVNEMFEGISKAVFESLGGSWQKVLAEVRLRAQCSSANKSALEFMKEHFFKLSDGQLTSIGDHVKFSSMKFESSAGPPTAGPLENPKREVSIEVLKEDPTCFYFETMNQWPMFAGIPASSGIDLSQARSIEDSPRAYVEAAYQHLQDVVDALSGEGKK